MIANKLVFGFMVLVTLGSMTYYTVGNTEGPVPAANASVIMGDGEACPYSGATEGECPYMGAMSSADGDPEQCPFLSMSEEEQQKMMNEWHKGMKNGDASKCPFMNGEKTKTADEIDI